MKILLLTFLLLFSFSSFSKNILIVGDSHSVGPFGKTLFSNLKKNNNVAIYAHSSSASYHWVKEIPTLLSGGAYHAISVAGQNKIYPFPSDWRIKLKTISFKSVLDDMLYHSDWKKKEKIKPELVVIALGANDYGAVTTESGTFNEAGVRQRRASILKMLDQVDEIGASCIWVLPPDGIKKSAKRQELLYRFLEEVIQNRCTLYNSNKFKTTGCDGIHFSCASQTQKAINWAGEVSSLIQ